MAAQFRHIEVIDLTGDSDEEMVIPSSHLPTTERAESARDAAHTTTQPSASGPGAPLPARLAWLRDMNRPAMPGAFPAEQETAMSANEASADFIKLPSSESLGWTPINPALPKLRRSRRILTRARRAAVHVAMPPRRRRSPSVEFLGSRLKGTEGPLSVADPAGEQASLTRSHSSSIEFVSERLRDDTSLRKAEGMLPAAAGPEELRDDGAPSPQPDDPLATARIARRARREALRAETVQVQDPYVAQHQAAECASRRLPGAEQTLQGSRELMIYTDGSFHSRLNFGGAGITYRRGNLWVGRAIALGLVPSSSDAELAAVLNAVSLARRVREIDERQITIATDSGDCLKWLDPNNYRAALTAQQEAISAVLRHKRELAQEGVHLAFRWVKGHALIEGNELADKLAGFGARESAKGLVEKFNVPDVYAQFPELKKMGLIQDLATGMRKAGATKRAEQMQKNRRDLKLRRRRELAGQAARGSSDQLIASRIAEIASQTLAAAQQGV